MTMKIILDTDIGSDIDDAVCLAYLLAQPECELLGITTVTGEAARRAMLAFPFRASRIASASAAVLAATAPVALAAGMPNSRI
jgi:inosine-uridine nucleoside N-ribohydrolase